MAERLLIIQHDTPMTPEGAEHFRRVEYPKMVAELMAERKAREKAG